MKALFLTALALTASAAVAAAAAAQTAKDGPIAPSGKWIADFGNNSCILSRAYGTGDSEKMLMFRPMPGAEDIEMALVTPYKGDAYAASGVATLTLRPGGQKAVAYYRDYSVAGGHRMIDFSPLRSDISKITAATAMELSFVADPVPAALRAKMPKVENPPTVDLALLNPAGAMKTIGDCEDQLLKSWGFDPEAQHAIRQKAEPIGSVAKWVKMADYPAEALSKQEAGIARIHYRIDTAGMLQDCGIFQSSGFADLDAAACRIMAERARFKPAKGADGKPMASAGGDTIIWIPPKPKH